MKRFLGALAFAGLLVLPAVGAGVPRAKSQNQPHLGTKDLDIQLGEDVKVRLTYAPVEFDDKGNPKKHTSAELKELKGPDPKLPGYTGDLSNLRNGQMVKLYLAKKKTAPATDKAKAAADDKGDNKSEKPKLTPLGQIEGQVANVNNGGKGKGDKGKGKGEGDSPSKITIKVPSLVAGNYAKRGQPAAANQATQVEDDIVVTMILIESPDKPPADKGKNNKGEN